MLNVSAIILCGGLSRRMGQDKGQMHYGEQTMVKRVAHSFKGAQEILLNCNAHQAVYQSLGFTTFADQSFGDIEPHAGPLLGVLSAMQTAQNDWLLFSPCDTPNLPENYLQRMAQHASDQLSFACVAFDGDRQQHLHVLLHKKYKESLMMYLLSGRRRSSEWLESIKPISVDFSYAQSAFKNINTMEDWES